MCIDCIFVRAKNFLLISGSFAMILIILILISVLGIVWRLRGGIKKIEQVSAQIAILGSIPLQLVEHFLQKKSSDKRD